jgi:hypothetical protein
MRPTAIKLLVCLAAVPLAVVLTWLTGSGYFLMMWLIAFPLLVLYLMDYSRELRSAPNPSWTVRVLALLMSVPQALFGLLTLTFGVAMILWVLYNSFIERQPEYSGGFLTFGIGPICILVGGGWILDAFRKGRGEEDQAQD